MTLNRSLLFLSLVSTSAFAQADALDALFEPSAGGNTGSEAAKTFSMDGELGVLLTTGNTETTSVKGKLNASHELENWSNDYVFEALYKQDEVLIEGTDDQYSSETSAQKIFLSGQGNYKLENPNHRLFAFGSYEDDRFSGFEYQATIAAGWAQQLWKSETSSFNYSVGPGYSFADKVDTVDADGNVIPGEDVSGMIVRGALDYKWKISDTATFRQKFSTEVGSDNTKSKSETSVSAQINGSLAMKVSLLLNHNSDVDPGIENLDTETAVTLVYTFF
ncbi:hypothetical protein HMF8227_00625 [Saliniradius amylolyticus]|uniref:Salt-induced outer membrane protein n=2 Tax=Saliniradius amylolyticus TaxID=2183582 RepID=A0A2S2E0E8_9ALTE|nr:DUF481 domain-containing protein [Saliniradius amylolyticus]AWL11121.1 hypothetical protein HMF8227_00625 [Saliniradius amylolyticus]